jgi:NodT family efflux transporter outer membrane factor (OMF) lipoprotein
MVGPHYKEPKTRVGSHWITHSSAVKDSEFKDTQWWALFHDANLTALICEGYRHNLSLQMAGVRVLQARAQLAQSVGALYPQQQALVGSYDYFRTGGGYLQDVLPPSFNALTLGFSANWEIDFWGKYRRAILANDAKFLASLAAYDSALVTLTADIAKTYITLRTQERLIKVTQDNIKLQKTSLRLTESRFRAGQVSMLDVQQAKTELAETQASLPTMISQLQKQKDALAVLLGILPNEVGSLLDNHRGIPKAPLSVAVGIPKETLARRPDVHQARLDAIAQLETIGAVKANLYPSLSLTGTFSFAANTINQSSISDVFSLSNFNVTTGPAFNWPILNYGQITNSVRAQDAVFQQSVLNYQNVVLKAQQEVQDTLTTYVESKKAEYEFERANRSSVYATKLTLIRYREGEADYTTVLTVEQQQLRVQKSLVTAQGDVPLALVELYRALGGGWQIRQGNDIVPKELRQEMAARTQWGTLLKQNNHQPPANKKQVIQQRYLPNW